MNMRGRNILVVITKQIFKRSVALLFILPLVISFGISDSTGRIDKLKTQLDTLAIKVPGLNNKVELSVNGLPVADFVRGVAVTNNLNISVESGIDTKIYDNFSDVTVEDVFVFLCQRYDLDISFVGNIMVFSKYVPPPTPVIPYSPKIPNVTWNASDSEVSFDLQDDSIALVVRELTRKTGKNMVFSSDLSGRKISGYIQNSNVENAMEHLAFANELTVTHTDDDFFLFEPKAKAASVSSSSTVVAAGKADAVPSGITLTTNDSLITLDATDAPIADLVKAVSAALNKEYFLFSELKGNATLKLKDASYDQFLEYVFNGTDYTSRINGRTYFIGERDLEGLRVTDFVKMQYRTVDKVVDNIPADMKKDVDVKAFPDLNGIILSGSQPAIKEIETFLRQIDQVVPMVLIEVMILDYNKSHTVAAGIKAGIGNKPVSSGSITPNIDLSLDGSEINNLISGLNGFGSLNLGYITQNFYVQLTALEQNGTLNVRSTPKLAALNGNEASMSIGSTEYYLEETTNIIGTQNPQTQITRTYKPLNADLSISITPMVSGDEQVTMNISVKQSTFTKRVSDSGPFGTTQRSFQSVVRVKNQEMVLLGGLEESSDNESGSGTPLLSRLPFFQWIFGLHSKTKSKTRLSILIQPTVIY